MLRGNVKEMNIYMNEVALSTFSSFDSGKHPSGKSEPERFYHCFVLGLLVELRDKYEVQSNRESGYGRYDVMIIPRDKNSQAVIIEFKVIDSQEETSLDMTADSALKQIEEKIMMQSFWNEDIKEKQFNIMVSHLKERKY